MILKHGCSFCNEQVISQLDGLPLFNRWSNPFVYCNLMGIANTVATERSVADSTRPGAAIGTARKPIKADWVVSKSWAIFGLAARVITDFSKSRTNGLSSTRKGHTVADAARPCSIGAASGPFSAKWGAVLSWLLRRITAFAFR
jgi:hypothetical protein